MTNTKATFCPSCRKLLVPGASFCAFCGTRLGEETPPAGVDAAQRNISLPQEQSLIAPCTVVVTEPHAFRNAEIGRLIAKTFGKPLSDVMREIRFSRGMLSFEFSPQHALEVANRIESLGVEAFVLGAEDILPLPEVERMRKPEIDANGIRCEAYTWSKSRRVEAGWNRVFLAAGARVVSSEVVEVPHDTPSPMRRKWAPLAVQFEKRVPKLETRERREYLLDVVLFNDENRAGWERLRLDENPAAYALAPRQEDSRAEILRAATRMRSAVKGVPRNSGIELLANQAPDEAWEALTFETKQEFDAYVRWLMHLVRYGFAMPT